MYQMSLQKLDIPFELYDNDHDGRRSVDDLQCFPFLQQQFASSSQQSTIAVNTLS